MAQNDVSGAQAVIDKYLNSYKHRNMDELASCVAKDDDFVAFGTDTNESWHGWDEYRAATERLFQVAREIEWKRGKTRIVFSRDGSCAWFSEELMGHFQTGGTKTDCPLRLSGVLENRGGNWLIVQFHRAMPVREFAVPYLDVHGVRFD